MKKILSIALILVILVGCSNKKNESLTTCTISEEMGTEASIFEITQELKSKDDVVTMYTSRTRIEAPSKEELDSVIEFFESVVDEMNKTEGIAASVVREGDTIINQVIEIDFVNAPDDALRELGFGDGTDARPTLSLKTMVSEFEAAGFTCSNS